MIVVHALRTLGPRATAPQVRGFLEQLTDFAGVNGIYDFVKVPQRGLDVSDAVVTRWSTQAKTWQVVSKPTGVPLPRSSAPAAAAFPREPAHPDRHRRPAARQRLRRRGARASRWSTASPASSTCRRARSASSARSSCTRCRSGSACRFRWPSSAPRSAPGIVGAVIGSTTFVPGVSRLPQSSMFVMTAGLLTLLEGLLLVVWGSQPYALPPFSGEAPVRVPRHPRADAGLLDRRRDGA